MAKVPMAGRVKTRLARGIGVAVATGFYRTALRVTLARAGQSSAWQTYMAVAPDTSVRWPGWPGMTAKIPQGSGDLGRRMQRVFDALPPGPVVIIGSDAPRISQAWISEAFAALGSHDAVIGPAPDGGYWLIGLKRTPRIPHAFTGVRWSAPETLADTLANLGELRVCLLDELDDVDEAADFARVGHEAAKIVHRP